MIKRYEQAALILILAFGAAFAVGGCRKPADTGAGNPAMQQGRGGGNRTPRVKTAPATIKPIVLKKEYVGEIQPEFSVDVRSTASGWLTSLFVDAGDRVEKNSIIGVVNHDETQTQVEQSQAGIAVSKAAVARADAELESVLLESRRTESLYSKGYISKRELEQAQTAEKQARAAAAAARGQLQQSQAQLKTNIVRLQDSTIRAPFSGVVAERFMDPGAYVSPSNPIIRLMDDARVKAVVNVVEEDAPRFMPGAAADVLLDSYPGEPFHGKIIRVSPAIDQVSRTAMVEILMDNAAKKFKSGMTVRASLVLAEKDTALVIPDGALRKNVETGESYVFVIENGKAAQRIVKTGIVAPGEAEILDGLKVGEAVAVGDVRLSDGMKVEASEGKGGRR